MSITSDFCDLTEFYQRYLGIAEKSRPLNAYQLLGTSELETNWVKIRTAIDRQRANLESCQQDVPPEIWRQAKDEVEQAIITINDADAKAVLDASLRRRRAKTSPATVASGPPPVLPPGTLIACRHCQKTNQGTRRFCAGCGQSLWDRCPQCTLEVTVEENFCGHCGTDINHTLTHQKFELENKISIAEKLASAQKFEPAITLLREVALLEDLKFGELAERAVARVAELQEEQRKTLIDADKNFRNATQYFERKSFENAIALLVDIPATLRTPKIDELQAAAIVARNEILALGGEIRTAMNSKNTAGLLPKIERLLLLKPNYSSAQQLATRLRDELIKRAKSALQEHDYRAGLDALQQILPFVRTAEIDNLQSKVEELSALADAIRQAPTADSVTIQLAERLVKVAPRNKQAQEWLKSLVVRESQPRTDPRQIVNNWATPPASSALGAPVDLLGNSLRLITDNAEIATTLQEHPGQFWVALGLALQGLDQAQISFDLSGQDKGNNVLGMISKSFKKKAKHAWGLDLSPAGLKAVKLGWEEKTQTLSLLGAEFIPHKKLLSHPDAELDRDGIIKETFQQFLSRHKLEGDCLVGGLSGQRVLGRFFEIPPMVAKKVPDAVQYETKHQVPIPLDDLNWGHFLYSSPNPKEADVHPRTVLVAAAREFHVKERLRIFKDNGINLNLLVAEPLALHNALHFEFFASDEHRHSRPGAIAVVDVGNDNTNVVVVAPDFCWFRTLGVGGHDFTQGLVKSFQLTYDQAERLKRNPGETKSLLTYWDVVQPLSKQMKGEVVRSIATFGKLKPTAKVGQIFGCGGGFPLFGLLRELRE